MKNIFMIMALVIVSSLVSAQEKAKPEDTEFWEPVPKIVTPTKDHSAPSDAIVLFDGSNTNEWQHAKNGGDVQWAVKGKSVIVTKKTGDIRTKKEFGSIQLHIEWKTPKNVVGEGQGNGNSGIFLQGKYELQVLGSYDTKTYVNGQAGSIYKQTAPLVNASKPKEEWQVYDVIYTEPKFDSDGKKTKSAYITVFHNGILIQNHTEILGTTEYIGSPKNIAHGKGPIVLQDHGNPVAFRNIWLREL